MKEFLHELIESLVGDTLKGFVSPQIQGCLGDMGFKILGVFILGFWYSGFADCDNYASRGYRIFFLPACGVVMAVLLYAAVFYVDHRFVDSATWIVLKIGAPFLIPTIVMFWIRERDIHQVMILLVVFGCLFLILILLLLILEAQEDWPTWARIVLLLVMLAIAYAGSKIPVAEPLDAPAGREKYAPLCLG